MPSLKTVITLTAFAFTSLVAASETCTKGEWIFGRDKSKCPDDDQDVYNGPSGGKWLIRCAANTDELDTQLLPETPNYRMDFQTCIQNCEKLPGKCFRVAFKGDELNPGLCYLKGDIKKPTVPKDGYLVATKLN